VRGAFALGTVAICVMSCTTKKSQQALSGDPLTPEQTDQVGACSQRSDASVPGDALIIACAEEFIRRNGYTDALMQLPVRLETVHDGDGRLAMERRRRGSLISGAVSICHEEREKTYDVVFKAKGGDGRGVAVPPSLVGIRMVHQDLDLSAILAGKVARCRLIETRP
jgi:hypothetical protein